MSAIFGIVAPVFALILLGAAAIRARMVEAAGLRGLNDFAFFLGIPALLFESVAEVPALRLLDVAGLYFAGCLAIYAAAWVLARGALRFAAPDAAMFGLNACYGNTVMLGVPVISAAFGAEGVASLLAIVTLHSALLLPLASVLIEAGAALAAALPRTARGLLRNPVIVAILLALAWRGLGLPVPDALHRLLALLAGAGPPVALFCLGASLQGLGAASAWREAAVATGLKLVAMPATVAALAWEAGLGGTPFAVAVVAAGMPTGANAFLLARRMDAGAAGSAGTVVLGTALSLATLSALLAWLRG